MRRLLFCVTALQYLINTAIAGPMDFQSVANTAILYDAPSVQGKKMFVILKGTPVEVIVQADKWAKVRDANGGFNWLEKQNLTTTRTVIVSASKAEIKEKPDSNARIIFSAEKDVILEKLDSPTENGWIKVRHKDGETGFVRTNTVWGV